MRAASLGERHDRISASKATSLVATAVAALALTSTGIAAAPVIGLSGAVASDAGQIATVTDGWRSCHWHWGQRHCRWRGYPIGVTPPLRTSTSIGAISTGAEPAIAGALSFRS